MLGPERTALFYRKALWLLVASSRLNHSDNICQVSSVKNTSKTYTETFDQWSLIKPTQL